jgi:hypothetical protein
MIEADFDSGALGLWTGLGTLTYNGLDYIGAGSILSISEIQETRDMTATNFQVTLDGLDETIVAIALDENYQERPCSMSLGVLNADGTLVASPYKFFSGQMDVMTISTGSDNITQDGNNPVTVSMSTESELIDGDRAITRYWVPEDQAIDFPSDTGFNYVAGLQTKQIIWAG